MNVPQTQLNTYLYSRLRSPCQDSTDLHHLIVPYNGVVPYGHSVVGGGCAIVVSYSDVGYLSVTIHLPVDDVIEALHITLIEVNIFVCVRHVETHVLQVVHQLRMREVEPDLSHM